MKTSSVSAIALLSLTLLLILAIANRIFIENFSAKILNMLEIIADFDSVTEDRVDSVIKYWESASLILGLTAPKRDILEVEEALSTLRLSVIEHNSFEYNKAMAQLKRAIAEMRDREKITFENVF